MSNCKHQNTTAKRGSFTKRLTSFFPWSKSKSKIDEDHVKVRGKNVTVLDSLGFTLTGEQLGEGANAVVLSGHSQRAGSEVAIKIYDKDKMIKENRKVYFDKFVMRELKIVAMVSHPNIVRCIAAAASPNRVYIVMERLSGMTVRDQIAKHFRLPEHIVGVWMSQLGDAVRYLHAKGIAHRDIKCSNLLLDDDDNIKLSDFGVSTHQLNDPKALGVIWSGTFVGNLEYAAPEILQEREYIATKSDMWSVGVVAYVCLYGHFPFNGSTPRQVYQDIKKGLKKSTLSRVEVSADCKDFYMKLMEKDIRTRMDSKTLREHSFYLKYKDLKIEEVKQIDSDYDNATPSITPPMHDFKLVEDDSNRLNKTLTTSAVDNIVRNCESLPDLSELMISKRESGNIFNLENNADKFLESSVDKRSTSSSVGQTNSYKDDAGGFRIETLNLTLELGKAADSANTDIDQTIDSSSLATESERFNSFTPDFSATPNISVSTVSTSSSSSVNLKSDEKSKDLTVTTAYSSSSSSFARLAQAYNRAVYGSNPALKLSSFASTSASISNDKEVSEIIDNDENNLSIGSSYKDHVASISVEGDGAINDNNKDLDFDCDIPKVDFVSDENDNEEPNEKCISEEVEIKCNISFDDVKILEKKEEKDELEKKIMDAAGDVKIVDKIDAKIEGNNNNIITEGDGIQYEMNEHKILPEVNKEIIINNAATPQRNEDNEDYKKVIGGGGSLTPIENSEDDYAEIETVSDRIDASLNFEDDAKRSSERSNTTTNNRDQPVVNVENIVKGEAVAAASVKLVSDDVVNKVLKNEEIITPMEDA